MSGQQNLAQTRVVDPILSEHARGYRQAGLIANALFPFADVSSYGGKVIEFDKAAFVKANSKRAPGSTTKRVQFGYEGKPYAIVPSALEAVVPRERMRDASVVPGINLASRAVNTVLRSLQLEFEIDAATIATNANNYDNNHKVTLTGADVWSDSNSDPVGDVLAGREAVRRTIGLYPNVLELPALALAKLKVHPKLLARASSTGIQVVTLDLLKLVFEVDNIAVGTAIQAASKDSDLTDVWGTSAVLAYVSPGANADANIDDPSYGYGYRIEGMPLVETPYWDQNSKSWVYGVSNDATPVLSGMDAGFLIIGAGL
ncbi:hypothetical protein KWH04_01140 [Xanthomonas campestris pv. trichodesmae]|uniref:Major capsid protein E n=2 Tax=Xanthomonas citri TaxID=346 RepID=A0AB33CK81_XANCI|nr:hypothetical protein [Xanthomonas citri]ASK91056.1 hypothetical protein XcvCFBP7111P_05670 [Xanthomonas citri pv. vignicola]MBV6779275.1 hypothetical protein [Xanthomonas campestris pv. trichodesmae]MBZ3921789.1 hypothetical protein [Xanthomonas campestris pv. trichodesmae]MBZ3926389.1 hypothetical protein [Xanthomonas citri pv. sesbaniae]